jgi:hypothetical protein
MIEKLTNYLYDLRDRGRIAVALARAAAMMQARKVDLTAPHTWEFCGFSQNGEDGVLQVLRSQLRSPGRDFLEIGAGDGVENNTAWLAVAEKYSGLMVEGDAHCAGRAKRVMAAINLSVDCRRLFVARENAAQLVPALPRRDPDVFSLDIDGNDYYIARALLDAGLRPKIIVVEYNSVFGPERSATIEYRENFHFTRAHPTQLYYGVSIAGWRACLAQQHGYRFVTVERNGANAFFVDPAHFDAGFLDGVRGTAFAESQYQYRKFGMPSDRQFPLIASQKFVTI